MGATNSLPTPSPLSTPKGTLNGTTFYDPTTKKSILTRYTRIPYALPPTGTRRWTRPQPLPENFSFSKENGEPGDYTAFGNVCPQPVYEHGSVRLRKEEVQRVYDEDCLFVNVWVPCAEEGEVPEEGWPVQVFIHGGWLQVGDASQNNEHDPYNLIQDFPRIIVSISYRLNVFGFLSFSPPTTTTTTKPGNYGFWDQRLALEWIYSNIYFFNGNPSNITLGGLSAGAYSSIFQLHYDTYLPAEHRIIKRVYLYSNAVGVQPKPVCSGETEEQFSELCTHFNIPAGAPPAEKLEKLRGISAQEIVDAIQGLKMHTFRAGTDDDFIPSTFLSSIHSGEFAAKLKQNNVSIMLGEVENEEMLYRLVNPATSYATLIDQLNNYYPSSVTNALLHSGLYVMPKEDAREEEWRDIFAKIVADCQVHATIRGFADCLLRGGEGLELGSVCRYRICWRAKGLDEWLDQRVGLCHAADVPIWWLSGCRAGFDEEDTRQVREWLRPQYQFLKGEKVEWGTTSERQLREFKSDGSIGIVEDEGWDAGLKVWEVISKVES